MQSHGCATARVLLWQGVKLPAVLGTPDGHPRLRSVAVDLTPLEPGGQNGGARLVALTLIRELSKLAPETQFVLLTNLRTHAELAALETTNVRRRCTESNADRTQKTQLARQQLRHWTRTALDRSLPTGARVTVKNAFWKVAKWRQRYQTVSQLNADLIFCPFTAPYFSSPRIPLVSIVYDLQHLTYPEFFADEQRRYRQKHIEDACRHATRVVCISDSVRSSLISNVTVAQANVLTIHLGLLQNLTGLTASEASSLLGRLGLTQGRFMLYPANFWQHKNHDALIHAMRRFRQENPKSDLRVVCTGTPNAYMHELAQRATAATNDVFVFAGFLPEAALATLLRACSALIFPSLFEGFGMPVLEAMAVGKPVLCSDRTSLPEVAGDAAVLFDPTQPEQIAAAIGRLETQPQLISAIAERGPARAARFGTASDMARRYLEVFQAAIVSHAAQRSDERARSG